VTYFPASTYFPFRIRGIEILLMNSTDIRPCGIASDPL
jgi:hypothetical protein